MRLSPARRGGAGQTGAPENRGPGSLAFALRTCTSRSPAWRRLLPGRAVAIPTSGHCSGRAVRQHWLNCIVLRATLSGRRCCLLRRGILRLACVYAGQGNPWQYPCCCSFVGPLSASIHASVGPLSAPCSCGYLPGPVFQHQWQRQHSEPVGWRRWCCFVWAARTPPSGGLTTCSQQPTRCTQGGRREHLHGSKYRECQEGQRRQRAVMAMRTVSLLIPTDHISPHTWTREQSCDIA